MLDLKSTRNKSCFIKQLYSICSDVCFEAKRRLEAAKVLPRRFDASPRSRCYVLGLVSNRDIGTSKLRYHNFHLFILYVYVLKTFNTKLLLHL